MLWNKRYLRDRVKSAMLMDRRRSDAGMPDEIIDEGMASAMKELARDCSLFPDKWTLALQSSEYKYPLPVEVDRIREVWFIDNDGTYIPLQYMAQDNYLAWTDPTDTGSEPRYFSYPHFQPHIFEFYAGAPPTSDYVNASWVTAGRIRTIQDSGINFGRTRSGLRVRPECVGHNLTDGSFGYIEYLDITTAKTTGAATAGTTTDILEDDSENFSTDNVAVGDIICTPSTGKVLAYAFVIEVAPGSNNDQLRYSDIEGQDANGVRIRRFESGDSFKVGQATEIRLWAGRPVPAGTRVAHAGMDHPGLRQGATNDFTVSATKATITGTTFTNTTVTGSSTSGAEGSDIAVASGGSHGTISGVDDNELTVDEWIGGLPTDGETVTVKEADKYQVEDRYAGERQIWIGPPASSGAGLGSENILMSGARMPRIPVEDDDPIEIPEHYELPLIACSKWQVADLRGIYEPAEIAAFRRLYKEEVRSYAGDVNRPPSNRPISPYRNRKRTARSYGRRDQTSRGIVFDISSRT
jgi:hypothetical protein